MSTELDSRSIWHAERVSRRPSAFEATITLFILFYGALVFCLPVPYTEEIALLYPWWSKRIEFGNIILHEIIFLLWVFLYGWNFVKKAILNAGYPARQSAIFLMALAIWCGFISLSAPLPFQDLGRTFRLLLNAALLLSVVRWTIQLGSTTLAFFICGFLSGTIINLIISFMFPLVVYDTMRLSGQNTPGVAMGIAIHLCAWLFYLDKARSVQLLSLMSALTFLFGCAISYSRIGWFAGGLGLCAWAYVLVIARPRERTHYLRMKKLRFVLLPCVLLCLFLAPTLPLVQEGVGWVRILVEQKLEGQKGSDFERWGYLTGTMEIVTKYPWGVGYSGFYDAMIATETYRSGQAAKEESPTEANPHASFLWYAAAGGLPAVLLSILLLFILLKSMRNGLISAVGRSGHMLFFLIFFPYVLIGLTVPYLFNSMILIVPTGIAAGWGYAIWCRDAKSTSRTIASL